MIPTLKGRIQTRLLLFCLVGIPVTILFGLWQSGPAPAGPVIWLFLLFLVTINLLGLILDPVYMFIQSFRWDRDWPFAYQLFFSILEFVVILVLARQGAIPWLGAMAATGAPVVGIGLATLHFLCVLVPTYLALLGPLSVFLIRWRFKGGEIGKL